MRVDGQESAFKGGRDSADDGLERDLSRFSGFQTILRRKGAGFFSKKGADKQKSDHFLLEQTRSVPYYHRAWHKVYIWRSA